MRPIWKGYITFGLVNIPVILYSAEKKFDIQFKLVDSRDKSRIRYVRINENTGEEVPWEDVSKGYEYDDHDYILLKDKDIKDIAGEHTKSVNIESFVNIADLNYMDFEKPYYIVPDKNGEKGYVLLREALKNTKKAGISKVIIHTREYLAALMPYENALVLNLLRYHQEIVKPSEFDLPSDNLKTYKISTKEVDIAKQLISSMTTKWRPGDYEDNFRIALEKWLSDKMHHIKPSKQKKSSDKKTKSNVINFVELLKKSLKSKKQVSKKPPAKKTKKHHK